MVRRRGLPVNRKRIERVMREHGIAGIARPAGRRLDQRFGSDGRRRQLTRRGAAEPDRSPECVATGRGRCGGTWPGPALSASITIRPAAKAGIGFTALSNGFAACDDPTLAADVDSAEQEAREHDQLTLTVYTELELPEVHQVRASLTALSSHA